MNNAEKIRAAVASIAHLPLTKVADSSRITEDLGLRSMQRVELAALLETELGSRVDDATVNRAKTVGELVTSLSTR